MTTKPAIMEEGWPQIPEGYRLGVVGDQINKDCYFFSYYYKCWMRFNVQRGDTVITQIGKRDIYIVPCQKDEKDENW